MTEAVDPPKVGLDYSEVLKEKLKADIDSLISDRLRLEREVKSYLPKKFILAYAELLDLGLGGVKSALGQIPESGVQGSAKGGLKANYITSNGGLQDQKAIDFRRVVDRDLRMFGRKIEAWLTADRKGRDSLLAARSARCAVCGKFIDSDYSFCPWCGAISARGLSETGTEPE